MQSCERCGRKWHLEKHRLITRDINTFECRCGATLMEWNGACFYSGVQMFDNPVTAQVSFSAAEPAANFEAGTQLEVTHYRQAFGAAWENIWCRRIHINGQPYLIAEPELMRAAGDPYEGRPL